MPIHGARNQIQSHLHAEKHYPWALTTAKRGSLYSDHTVYKNIWHIQIQTTINWVAGLSQNLKIVNFFQDNHMFYYVSKQLDNIQKMDLIEN